MATDHQFIAQLLDAVTELQKHVEELGCTCATTEQYNTRHAVSRRLESECTGVALAVKHRALVRQIIKHQKRVKK